MTQTKRNSLIESCTNVAVGYGVACATQYIVFPLFGFAITFRDTLVIGIIFTVVSIARSYFMRRIFNYFTG